MDKGEEHNCSGTGHGAQSEAGLGWLVRTGHAHHHAGALARSRLQLTVVEGDVEGRARHALPIELPVLGDLRTVDQVKRDHSTVDRALTPVSDQHLEDLVRAAGVSPHAAVGG